MSRCLYSGDALGTKPPGLISRLESNPVLVPVAVFVAVMAIGSSVFNGPRALDFKSSLPFSREMTEAERFAQGETDIQCKCLGFPGEFHDDLEKCARRPPHPEHVWCLVGSDCDGARPLAPTDGDDQPQWWKPCEVATQSAKRLIKQNGLDAVTPAFSPRKVRSGDAAFAV